MDTKRNVLLLNLLLSACALWMGWSFYQGWQKDGSDAVAPSAADSLLTSQFALPGAQPVSASGSQVIQRNPFSSDRNSIAEEPVAVQSGPPPQLPVVIGTMRLRDHYEALMAENAQNAGSSFKQVKAGDTFAGYKVTEIRDEEIVVELNGQKSTINIYLSASNVVRNSARTLAAESPPAAAPRVETSATAQPSTSSVGAAPAAAPVQLPSPDPLLKITIEGNRRRFERTTMFGPQVWYEDIK